MDKRICPSLSIRNIELTPFSRMNVTLAAQIVGNRVGNVLQHLYGDQYGRTAEFILLMNRWFDMMNVKALGESKQKVNNALAAYVDINDARL